MSLKEMMRIDMVVRQALGVTGSETIDEVAQRIVAQWPIAQEILRQDGEPWERMKRAADVAERLGMRGDE